MMIIYVFGILDLLAGISMLLNKFGIDFLGFIFASYLVVKGIIFFRSIASWIDLASGIVFFYLIYADYFGFILYLFSFWLIQKGLFSFFNAF